MAKSSVPRLKGPEIRTKADFKNLFPHAPYSGTERAFFLLKEELEYFRQLKCQMLGNFTVAQG